MSVSVPGYDDLRFIGEGGFSRVYMARQVEFDRPVALKVLRSGLDDRQRERFERECRAMGIVSQHPNIVTVLSTATTSDGHPVIVMELHQGGNYATRLQRVGPLPAEEVCRVGIRIAGALQTAHDRGLLHLDVKPQNLLVSDFGEPVLADLGVASFIGKEASGGGLSERFAAPEILQGQRPEPQSDVYSLAATLYVLLTGLDVGPQEHVTSWGVEPSIAASTDRAFDALRRLLLSGVASRPANRLGSAQELGRSLQAIQAQAGWDRCDMVVSQLLLAPRSAPATDVAATDEPTSMAAHTVARSFGSYPPPDSASPPVESSRKRTGIGTIALLATVLAATALGGAWLWVQQDRDQPMIADLASEGSATQSEEPVGHAAATADPDVTTEAQDTPSGETDATTGEQDTEVWTWGFRRELVCGAWRGGR